MAASFVKSIILPPILLDTLPNLKDALTNAHNKNIERNVSRNHHIGHQEFFSFSFQLIITIVSNVHQFVSVHHSQLTDHICNSFLASSSSASVGFVREF